MSEGTFCGIPSEAALQRACGTLYITHGLESTCGLVLFLFFSVVAVKLHCRNHLNSPALSFIRFILYHTYTFIDEYLTTLYTVGQQNELKLEARLRFCGNLDKMANAISASLSLLGITRWLSIGNVNGMRYIGYALTCPLTQVELVAMLAPIIPCYQFVAFTSFALTLMTLVSGYVASLLEMPVYEGDLLVFLQTWNVDDFAPTQKFAVVAPSFAGITILWFVVLPYLMIMYTCHGGNSNLDLPQEYRFLVSMVWITWMTFPVWWLFSWEGNAIITDTKFNEIGFTVLNMTAKGLFTLQSFRVGELADERMARQRGSGADHEGDHVPPIISRASSRKLSKSQFVNVLRQYDNDSDAESSDSDRDDRHNKSGDDYNHGKGDSGRYGKGAPSGYGKGAPEGQGKDRFRAQDGYNQRDQRGPRDQRGQHDQRDMRGQVGYQTGRNRY